MNATPTQQIVPTTTDTTAPARCNTFALRARLLIIILASQPLHTHSDAFRTNSPGGHEEWWATQRRPSSRSVAELFESTENPSCGARNKLLLSWSDHRKPGCWSLSRASCQRQGRLGRENGWLALEIRSSRPPLASKYPRRFDILTVRQTH